MLNKLKVLMCRLKTASFSRMRMHIRELHRECGRSRVSIFVDMLWCSVRYGVGYLDYHVFGFAHIRGSRSRSTFMTMNDNLALVCRVNQAGYRCCFQNKLMFWERFSEYMGREYINLEQVGPEEFEAFVKRHGIAFAKPVDDFGGHGIRKIAADQVTNWDVLYADLRAVKSVLIEEQIVQHPEMARLNPASVNTLRMVTLVKDGRAHLMYTLVRVGSGSSPVDNISSGGMYAPVWEGGKIARPAFCDATGAYYDRHPFTQVPFAEFTIPEYGNAVALVKRAALEVEQIKYVGWDVAISDRGPVLVEGNVIPGYDMCQNYHHLRKDKQGILQQFAQYYPSRLQAQPVYSAGGNAGHA